jgi:hypothetical protein
MTDSGDTKAKPSTVNEALTGHSDTAKETLDLDDAVEAGSQAAPAPQAPQPAAQGQPAPGQNTGHSGGPQPQPGQSLMPLPQGNKGGKTEYVIECNNTDNATEYERYDSPLPAGTFHKKARDVHKLLLHAFPDCSISVDYLLESEGTTNRATRQGVSFSDLEKMVTAGGREGLQLKPASYVHFSVHAFDEDIGTVKMSYATKDIIDIRKRWGKKGTVTTAISTPTGVGVGIFAGIGLGLCATALTALVVFLLANRGFKDDKYFVNITYNFKCSDAISYDDSVRLSKSIEMFREGIGETAGWVQSRGSFSREYSADGYIEARKALEEGIRRIDEEEIYLNGNDPENK